MDNSMVTSGERSEFPQYVYFVIVISRMLYAGIASMGVMFVITRFVSVPLFPSVVNPVASAQWLVLLVIVSGIVMFLGMKWLIVLSWSTAAVFSSEVRDELRESQSEEKK